MVKNIENTLSLDSLDAIEYGTKQPPTSGIFFSRLPISKEKALKKMKTSFARKNTVHHNFQFFPRSMFFLKLFAKKPHN